MRGKQKAASTSEWSRLLHYMEREVKPRFHAQRATLQGGPFEWFQKLSGKVFGEQVGPYIVRFFLEDDYQSRENTDHDFIFKEKKVELKIGTEHSTSGVFLFEQIRPQQDWDILLCVGIGVRSLTFFVLSRRFVERAIVLWQKGEDSVITPQHGGAKRRDRSETLPDTFWLWTKQNWMQQLKPFHTQFSEHGWAEVHLKTLLTR